MHRCNSWERGLQFWWHWPCQLQCGVICCQLWRDSLHTVRHRPIPTGRGPVFVPAMPRGVLLPGHGRLLCLRRLELVLSQMAQKPMLRGEVGARALRVRSDVRGHGQVRLCKALGCGRCGCLKPIRACCVVGSAFFLVAPPRGGCAMAPRDSGMCWKQFMMCLEEIQFVAGVHSPPMHDPGRRRNSRP